MVTKEEFLRDFKELLKIEGTVDFDTDLLDIEEWDSYSAISLLGMIEEKYGKKIEPYAIAEAIFIEDIFNIIQD